MADQQQLQNAAAALSAAFLGCHITTKNVTSEVAAGLYFECFDALVSKDGERHEAYAAKKREVRAAEGGIE